MTGRTLAAIALRIWGIVFLVGALTAAPQTIISVTTAPPGAPAWMSAQGTALLLNVAARALVGLALIIFADSVVALVIPRTEPLAIDADAQELSALALGVAGVLILVWALQDVASIVYTAVTKPPWLTADSWPSYIWGRQREAVVRVVVGLIAGVFLVFGKNGLAQAWWRVRGLAPEPEGEHLE